jgi:hypothetical protein
VECSPVTAASWSGTRLGAFCLPAILNFAYEDSVGLAAVPTDFVGDKLLPLRRWGRATIVAAVLTLHSLFVDLLTPAEKGLDLDNICPSDLVGDKLFVGRLCFSEVSNWRGDEGRVNPSIA